MARHDKLTEDRERRILDAIRQGMTYERAAQAAGVSDRTLYYWKSRGEQAKSGKFFRFLQAIKEAEADGEAELLDNIREAGAHKQHWQANAWILERRHPERWSKTQKFQIDLSAVSDEQLDSLIDGDTPHVTIADPGNS